MEQKELNLCSTTNCGKEAKLRCPECIKYKIMSGSWFCGKDCFKSFWSKHKDLHSDCKFIN